MAKKGSKIPAKTGVRLYGLLMKELTAYNNRLPLESRYSIAHRRRIIKEYLYPQFKGKAYKEKSLKNIRSAINNIGDVVEPVEICNLNYLSPVAYQFIEYYALDNFFTNVLPRCVFAKVSAGQFGETDEFSTEDYNYSGSGVRDIVEEVRDYVLNQSGYCSFTGYVKVRDGRKNDGLPDSYYLDLIAYLDGEPVRDTIPEPERYEPPKGQKRKASKAKSKVKKVIDERLKEFKKIKSKQGRKRAAEKKKAQKPPVKPKKKVTAPPAKETKADKELKVLQEANKKIDKMTALIDKVTALYEKGLISKKQLQTMLANINI
jgi:hypothetical protein